jgi:plasmid stabilization system protein ParE
MKIIYTRKARADLTGIYDYHRSVSSAAIQEIVHDITSMVDAMPASISRGRKTENPKVWEKLSKKYKYLLPYCIHSGDLYILRVYDSTQRGLDYRTIIDLTE